MGITCFSQSEHCLSEDVSKLIKGMKKNEARLSFKEGNVGVDDNQSQYAWFVCETWQEPKLIHNECHNIEWTL